MGGYLSLTVLLLDLEVLKDFSGPSIGLMHIGFSRKTSIFVSKLIGNKFNISSSSLVQECGTSMPQRVQTAVLYTSTLQQLIESLPQGFTADCLTLSVMYDIAIIVCWLCCME